jgi:predicted metal-dependent HD superfamily phosphohydrolase
MKNGILASAKIYISNCYESNSQDLLIYHSFSHTNEVVSHCKDLADYYNLNKKSKFYLLVAAWFHDVGYLYTTPEEHEEKSIEIMRSFLQNVCSPEELLIIERLILATKISTRPATLLESIIRDADSYHFGTKEFFLAGALVKREMELRTGSSFPDWTKRSLELLRSHEFYTNYCKEHLDAGKRENIATLESLV